MSSSELAFLPATRMAELVRQRQLSPVELVEAHLARIEKLNPKLNAFVRVFAAPARETARRAEAAVMRGEPTGPLHGVPITIKDSIEMTGAPSLTGSRLREGFVPERDAFVAECLRNAGAIILGKTNVPEMLVAYETDNLVTGATSNPWNLERTAGGSSGGEAAAIAAGCSAGGVGSDGGGSVRVPAHFSGITALKPTPGRISGRGHFPTVMGPFATLGMLGPMARNVEDLRALASVIAAFDPEDPVGVPLAFSTAHKAVPSGTRVGLWVGEGTVPLTADSRAVLDRAASLLREQGCAVEDFPAPDFARAVELWWNVFGRTALPLVQAFARGREHDLSPIAREFLADASAQPPITLDEFLQTSFERDQIRNRLSRRMQDVPVLLTAVGSIPAFVKGEREWNVEGQALRMWDIMRPCVIFNLLGNPAVVVPAGFSSDGLPVAVQLVGRPYEEEFLLDVAAALEEARGHWPAPAAIA